MAIKYSDRSTFTRFPDGVHYKLVINIGGRVRYAETKVSVSASHQHDRVAVSDRAYAWMDKPNYPSRKAPLPNDPYILGAIHGVKFALKHSLDSDRGKEARITIEEIQILVVDTTPMAVATAACYATWIALDTSGTILPIVGERDMELPEV